MFHYANDLGTGTMKRTTILIFLLTVILSSTGVISVRTGSAQAIAGDSKLGGSAATPVQRRMLRILTGRSEPARLKLISQWANQPDQMRAHLGVIAEATDVLLRQHADEMAKRDDSKAKENRRLAFPDGLARLINLLGNSPRPEHIAVLIDALNHADERIAMVVIDTVGQFEVVAAVDGLAAQIKRVEFEQQYAFRFALVRAIAKLHCPRSVELLHQLHAQLDGQLRHEITDRLKNVDLRDFAGDRQLFARYQKDHPPESLINRVSFNAPDAADKIATTELADSELADSELATNELGDSELAPTKNPTGRLQLVDTTSESTQRLKLSDSHYYGIELRAARMLFVIDRSGSMKRAAQRATRLQRAKQELIRVIEGLRPGNEFSIVLFDTFVQPWRSELVPATKQNKLAAIAFAQRITLGDKTNTHGVLSEALSFDDQLEAVFVLTDGQPTAGDLVRPDEIIRDIVTRNRSRHLKFHTIGFGVNPVTSEFLESLAQQTGGEFREAN